MFDEFGRMDLDGINARAEELANAGNGDGVRQLAGENGLPDDLVTAYLEGDTDYLCEDVTDAALGRIDIEADDLGAEEIMGDWADYVRALVMDSEKMAAAVMDPGKSFAGCVGTLAAWSIMHAEPAPSEVIKAIDKAVTDAQLKKLHMERRHVQWTKIGMPGIGTAKKLIREYYGGA